MKIIVLNGKAECGKTTVLKKLYAKLVASELFYQTFFHPESRYDLSAIFEYSDKKLGITTLGDSKADLEKAFKIFIEQGCDLVVSASRSRDTKSGAIRYIKSLSSSLIWYKKAYVEKSLTKYDATSEIDEINELQAKILFGEILLQI